MCICGFFLGIDRILRRSVKKFQSTPTIQVCLQIAKVEWATLGSLSSRAGVEVEVGVACSVATSLLEKAGRLKKLALLASA